MNLFTPSRENRYWFFALLVVMAILSSLFFGPSLQEALFAQETQAILFLSGLILCTLGVVFYGFYTRIGRFELFVWLGLAAVYVMLIFRLGAPERSHLIEYSILAVFFHRALLERMKFNKKKWPAAIWAFAGTFGIGILDESLQLFLPERVFDPEDIVFNGLAAFMALGVSLTLHWTRRRFGPRADR